MINLPLYKESKIIFFQTCLLRPKHGQFLNLGPREEIYTVGDTINFDFSGIVSEVMKLNTLN